MSTPNLKENLKSLTNNGVEIAPLSEKIKLGNKKSSKLTLVWGPDYNRIMLVEHKKTVGHRIDHLLLLVSDLPANLKFFQEVLAAEILEQGNDFARIQVAKHEFILAKPAHIGLRDEEVIKRHPQKFTPNIDHLGFLYASQEELKLAFQKATNAGYQILMTPKRMDVFDKPTPYVFGILFSPDGLQIELETEDGRIGPRTKYQTLEPSKEN
jgi:catechol 2,3-dioxygenase-like lactoylglutathione lyase family enzyme